MREALVYRNGTVTFRQWSGKSYAIFSSLSKEVNIGHIDIDICDKAFKKSSNKDNTVKLSTESVHLKNDDEDEVLSENIDLITFSLLSFTSNLEDSSRYCRKLRIIHISNYSTLPLR